MAMIKRCSTAVVVPLLVVLSLILGGLYPPLYSARANPGELYAAPAAQGSGDCSGWDNACTLQTALGQVVSGDEIWVQVGVHYPGAAGQREATFALQSSVAIYGGFAGWESELDQRDWIANITVLSGDIDQNDLTDPNGVVTDVLNIQGENAYHVVTSNGVTETAVLDGFVITAGQAKGGDYPHYVGGGMHNDGSSPTLDNVTFSGNTAYGGGGMSNWYNSSPTLTGVTFRGNVASLDGGGMFNDDSSPTLIGVTFSDNVAFLRDDYVSKGGGMFNVISSPTLTGVTFSGNSATYGGGIYHYNNSNSTQTNVIIWGNTALNGAGMYNDTSTPQISYSDLQGCGGSGNWNSDCGTDGGGNIDADPLFVDASNGDLRLQLASPAIDAGDNTALPPDIFTDLDGNPRFVDIPTVPDTGSGAAPIVDMGAYEAQFIDVTLSKAVLPPEAAPGEAITFSLTLANTGSLPATGIVVTDTLPALLWGVSFTSTLSVTDTGYLPPYVWLAQDLAPGQAGLITVSGVLTIPLAAGTYTNTAFVSAAGDLLAENNTAMITFTVPNVAPVFTSAPVLMATEDAPYTYMATAQDDNGDALTITAPMLPIWLTLQDHGDGTATLSGTPDNADVGAHPVVLRVTDHAGLFAEQAFTVTVANINDAPFFTSTPVLTAAKDAPYAYAVTTDDPDLIHGDTLTITASTLPAWLSLVDHGDGTATLSGTPTSPGDYPVILQVTDHLGAFAEQSFAITVAEKPHSMIFLPLMLRSVP